MSNLFKNINIHLKDYFYDNDFKSETNFIGEELSMSDFDCKLSIELIDLLELRILGNFTLQMYFQLQLKNKLGSEKENF